MGEVIKCPLCCSKTFESKIALTEHLAGVLSNIRCPICDNKWSSLAHLIEHLNLDNCSAQVFDVQTSEGHTEDLIDVKPCTSEMEIHENEMAVFSQESTDKEALKEESLDITDNKMYAELISKHVIKQYLQTQELKFVEENGQSGQSRYVFMEEIESDLNTGSKVVTKLNNDGTISMTTVTDKKLDSDSMINPAETESDETQEEIYSCNSCGVSFSSVIEHIQNYHNDQEVVVEEPLDSDEVSVLQQNAEVDYDPMMTEGSINNSNFTSRRMITDTGDIVEAPMVMKATDDGDSYHKVVVKQVQTQSGDKMKMYHCISCNVYFSSLSDFKIHPCTLATEKPKEPEKAPRGPARRYVQIDKFCDSHIKDISPSNEKDGPFHKAIVKEIESSNGEKVKMYQCIVCHIYVTDLAEMKTQPCKSLKYSCPHCPVAYENAKSLCAHMKVHKVHKEPNAEPTTYNCEICCTMFLTNKSLKLHKRMHDPIKSRPIDPPVRTIDGNTEVTDEARYLCNICNKLIPEDYRTIHQHSHKSSNKMNCTICNKKFTSNEYLEMHMKAHNMNKIPENKTGKVLPYSCVFCPRRFARPHEKVKHERIHTGEKPHSCEICGKSFRVSYCLTLHMRTHTGARPYECPHCGKRFKAHSVYNHHLLTHSEKRAYKCPICPKAFKTSVQLAGHKKCHTKPFSCQHCNRPFASLYAVRVHMETHARQNNLKFTCPLCGARYARAFALKDHIKQVHQMEMDAIEKMQPEAEKAWVVGDNAETELIATTNIKHDIQEVDTVDIPTSKENSLITILDMNEEIIGS